MIGYKKNLYLFLHMSRKELQQLCKQHNLPANRSHAQLAKSLASFFKKRNVSSAVSVEKVSNSMDKFCRYSFVTEPQATQTNSFLEESARGGCRRFCHIHNRIGVNHMGSSTSDKPRTTFNALCSSCHGNQKGAEDFEHCNICLATEVRETRSNLGVESKEASIRSECGKILDFRNTEQKSILDTTRNSRTCNILRPCGHTRPHECSTVSGFVSADEISTRSPSLQFFVMSEGGINLYVDLDSRPSEWINSLKDDVCVYQNAEHDESRTLSKNVSDSLEIDDHMKHSPCGDIVMNLEGIGGEQNIGCSNSSMSSVVSENCGSEAYPVDTTVATSGSSALTSGSIPAELSGCLEENQVVSSSCAAKSVQNKIMPNVNVASCPIEGAQLIHYSINTSSLMVNSSASLPDAMKSIGNEDDDAINLLPIIASTPKSPCADSVHAEDNALPNIQSLSHIPGKDNTTMSMEIQQSIETSLPHHLNDRSGAHEGSFMLCVNKLPDKVNPGGGFSGPDQLGHMVLDGHVGNAQSEVGAVDGPLNLQEHCTYGTLVPECPRLTFQDELGQRTTMRVKETSDKLRQQFEPLDLYGDGCTNYTSDSDTRSVISAAAEK